MKRVLAVVAVVFGLVAPIGVLLGLSLRRPGSDPEHDWRGVECEMGEIVKALNDYSLNHKHYPPSLSELEYKHFPNGVPKDRYSRKQYDYVPSGDRFFLVCYGHDKKAGGAEPPNADIVFSERGRLGR